MKNQELGFHVKLKIGNQESWESHTSQKCHMDANPLNEWGQVGQVGWIGLGGEFHFKGEIYSTLHILGFNFFLFLALKYIMSEIFKNVFQTVEFFLNLIYFQKKNFHKNKFQIFFFIFTSQWRNDFCIHMIDVITFVFMWMTS